MDYKHCCVINASGYYQTFVLVLLEPQEDGTVENKVQGYDLLTGEQLIEATPPTGFVKAHWTGAAWEESATAEEIATWEAEHPAPEAPPPSQLDSVEAQSIYTAMMTNTLLEG
jgi:hypothetical protein